jgi:hypothetical protein
MEDMDIVTNCHQKHPFTDSMSPFADLLFHTFGSRHTFVM